MSKTLYQKIGELQASVRALKKDTQAYNYKYVAGDKLLGFVRPKMDELHLLLLPEVMEFTTEPVTYPAWDNQNKRVVDKMEILAKIDVRFTWVDTDSGETLVQYWAGSGMNGFDKGYGSALTYAERYYLLKALHIATDEDDVDAIATTRDEAIEKAVSALKPSAPVQPSPAPQKPATKPADAQKRHVGKGDPFIADVLSWTRKQKNAEAAIERARNQYDWEAGAFDEYAVQARADAEFRRQLAEGAGA